MVIIPVFSGVRVTRSFVLYVMFCRLLFVLFFLLAIVLSVPFQFADSDYHFGIFKLFLFHKLYISKGQLHLSFTRLTKLQEFIGKI